MSIILKGIDLPSKDKSPLLITVWADGVVCSVDSNGGIEETTSAIQIPKGHGRIGDLGKLAKLISEFGESLKESARGNKLLITERDLCYAVAVLTEHFQEYEPLLEAEEE